MTLRPLIGIPCATVKRAGNLRPVYAGNPPYIHALEEAGGIPVLLPLFERPENVAALRGRLDGVLLMGGGDIAPARYGEWAIAQTEPPDAERDAMELELVDSVLSEGLPILGICRGMQLLNVARGGTLYQDIGSQLSQARNHNLSKGRLAGTTHPIEIQAGSRLEAIVGGRHHEVNSYHHQAVHRPGRDVEITARADDGVAEALELRDHPFAIAVQYHPERMYQRDGAAHRLFEEFVRACRARMETVSPVPPPALVAG
jgi:putative glutamine amidotransferase